MKNKERLPPNVNYTYEVMLIPHYFCGSLLAYLSREDIAKAIELAKERVNNDKEQYRIDHLKMVAKSSVDDVVKALKLLRIAELQERVKTLQEQIEDCKQRINNVKQYDVPESFPSGSLMETGISFLFS